LGPTGKAAVTMFLCAVFRFLLSCFLWSIAAAHKSRRCDWLYVGTPLLVSVWTDDMQQNSCLEVDDRSGGEESELRLQPLIIHFALSCCLLLSILSLSILSMCPVLYPAGTDKVLQQNEVTSNIIPFCILIFAISCRRWNVASCNEW